MEGGEVLAELLAQPATRDIPIVILSADPTPGRIQRLLESGATDHLTKPLDIAEFLDLLDRHLGTSER